jgi:hypothetical protein
VPSDPFDLLGAKRAVFMSALPTDQKVTALALLDHWSRSTATFPGVERLAWWTSCSRRTVIRCLQALEDAGHIGIVRESGRANRYDLLPLMSVPVSEGHQCQPDTGDTRAPVSTRHPTSASLTPRPVPPGHGTSASLTPEVTQEVIQPSNPRKEPRVARAKRATARKAPADFVFDEADRKAEEQARAGGVDVEATRKTWLAFEYEEPKRDLHRAWRNWLAKERPRGLRRGATVQDVPVDDPAFAALGKANAQKLLAGAPANVATVVALRAGVK